MQTPDLAYFNHKFRKKPHSIDSEFGMKGMYSGPDHSLVNLNYAWMTNVYGMEAKKCLQMEGAYM